MPDPEKSVSKVYANNNSNAVGSISAGGDISGNIHVGNIGYSSEDVAKLLTQITSTFQPKPFDGTCPYKGLDVFEEEDAELFFGREKLVEELVRRVKESRTVFITGPSGSGKSSLVRAGLIPALKQGQIKGSERWLYATMKPGRDPFEALAVAFSRLKSPELGKYFREHSHQPAALNECAESALSERKDQRLVLFIDQFEEVFTQVSKEEERIAFLNLLTHVADAENGRVILLFSMRSDFVPNCAIYPELNAALNRQFIQIGAMQPDELVSAIAQPALRVGLRIDPDLIAQIINDMKGEPGALPLMSFALKDLFEKEQAKGGIIALTLSDYLENKGVNEALQRHADAALAQFNDHEKKLAQSIFSGLIEIGRGTQDTKRTALFSELIPTDSKPDEVKAVVQKLADARLVTTEEGSDKYTITHEKLIDAWPWLKKLINENREAITLQNEIASAAKEWKENKRDTSYLYSGGRLANIWEQVQKHKLALGYLALEFVQAGRRRQQRIRAALISAVSAVLIAAIVASVVFQNQAQVNKEIAQTAQAANAEAVAQKATAQANANEANLQAKIALARKLAIQAQSIEGNNSSKQMLSTLLAITSMALFPTSEGSYFLLNKNDGAIPILNLSDYTDIAFSKNSRFIAAAQDKTTYIWEISTGKEITHSLYDETVDSVSVSPYGDYVASKLASGIFHLWNVKTEKEDIFIKKDVTSIAFSQDGKYIVTGNQDKTIHVLMANSGEEVAQMSNTAMVSSVSISPDSNYVVLGSEGGIVCVWAFLVGSKFTHTIPSFNQVQSVFFSPSGNYVISQDEAGNQFFWKTTSEKEDTPTQIYGFFSFSADDKYLVTSDSYTIKTLELATGREIASMKHDNAINSLAFSHDSKYIVSGSEDGIVQVWDAFTGKEVSQMSHEQWVNSVDISPDGKYVVSGSTDGTARLWEAKSGKEIARVTLDYGVVYVAFSPDGNYIISESHESAGIVWSPTSGSGITSITHNNSVRSVAFSSDGKSVISGSIDTTARIWDATNGKEIINMNLETPVYAVAFSKNGKFVAIGGDRKVSIYESANGRELFSTVANDKVYSVAFSPNSKYVAFVEDGSTVLVEEIASSKVVFTINMASDLVTSVTFSPNGKYLASGNDDTASVWEVSTGNEISHMNHNNWVTSVDFSPDSKYVVSGSLDNTARVWSATDGEEVIRLSHDTPVNDVAFSPDGKFIVTGSLDGIAHIWELESGTEIASMSHDGSVNSVAFSPDGRYVVSGSEDGTARVWEWQPKDVIANACKTISRNLSRAEWTQYIGDALPYQAVCPNLPIEPDITLTPTATP